MSHNSSSILKRNTDSDMCVGAREDHPTPGTGRGTPEIDLFETSADPKLKLGVITQSYQIAPYDI